MSGQGFLENACTFQYLLTSPDRGVSRQRTFFAKEQLYEHVRY